MILPILPSPLGHPPVRRVFDIPPVVVPARRWRLVRGLAARLFTRRGGAGQRRPVPAATSRRLAD